MSQIDLLPLQPEDREQFILDNQEAFLYGATEEFGMRDDHFEEDGQIISRKTIEESIGNGEAYRIVKEGKNVGGVIIKVDGNHGHLDILFVSPKAHSKGIGYAAWREVEKLHPDVKVWDRAVIFGPKESGALNTAEDLARLGHTISYEVLTALSKRVRREIL